MVDDEKLLEFGSEEWLLRYKEEVNSSESYRESAKTWEGDFLFLVNFEDDDPRPEGNPDLAQIRMYIDLYHGECREVHEVPVGEDPPETEFVYEGTYKNWRKLLDGEIHPIRGLLQRKFRLQGNMKKVMRYVKAAQELVKATQQVPTAFPE